jgi:hypothetical protein
MAYRGYNGLGMVTARTYATAEEARCAIQRKTRKHMGSIKANGPLPQTWAKQV